MNGTNVCVNDGHPGNVHERDLTAHDDANGYVQYLARRAYRANAGDVRHGHAVSLRVHSCSDTSFCHGGRIYCRYLLTQIHGQVGARGRD